jgi:Family of unknown function (DUF5681)
MGSQGQATVSAVKPENRRETGTNTLSGAQATRFKPGQSGNPGGRPRTAPLSQACRELLARPVPGNPEGCTYAEAIAQKLAEKAIEGDIRAAQELADRAEGRARQSIEVHNVRLREAFGQMSREELEGYACSGKLPSWFPRTTEPNDEPTQ